MKTFTLAYAILLGNSPAVGPGRVRVDDDTALGLQARGQVPEPDSDEETAMSTEDVVTAQPTANAATVAAMVGHIAPPPPGFTPLDVSGQQGTTSEPAGTAAPVVAPVVEAPKPKAKTPAKPKATAPKDPAEGAKEPVESTDKPAGDAGEDDGTQEPGEAAPADETASEDAARGKSDAGTVATDAPAAPVVDPTPAPSGNTQEGGEAPQIDAQGQEPAKPEATPLPDDFPGRAVLLKNGYDTVEKVKVLGPVDLLGISGIGELTADQIAVALKA